MRLLLFLFLVLVIPLLNCGNINPPGKSPYQSSDLPLDRIKLPEGFKIELYAEGVKNARSMALSPNGTLFVGTRSKGDVYAVQDLDGDYKADKVYTIAKGLKLPNGVAFRNGSLYVAEVNRILRYDRLYRLKFV